VNATTSRNPQKTKEDYMKRLSLSKLFIVAALLCTPLMASNAQAPNVKSPRISSGANAILCMPGLVFRCNKFGCFCLPPK
jgi:hypothetical protein